MNLVSAFKKMLSINGNKFNSFGKSLYLPMIFLALFGFSYQSSFSQGALEPRIEDITFIDIATNNVAHLDAFPVNTEFKVRVIGRNLTNLRFIPSAGNRWITVVRAIDAPARASQKEFVVMQRGEVSPSGSNSLVLGIADFANREGNRNKPMLDYQREFNSTNKPTCHIYDKPRFRVTNSLTGIYDRPKDKVPCNSLNTGVGSYTVAEDKYCTKNVPNPTVEQPLQEKEVTMAPITFKIKNDSYAPIFKPFKVKIKNGINVIKEFTVNRLIAQEEKTITFTRDQQKKIFARHRDCPKCYEKNQAPFNWLDIPLTIVIDEENVTGGGGNQNGVQIRASLNP